MGKANANRLGLNDQLKIVEWLKENWERRVIAEKLSATQVADITARELGIEKVTDGNIRGILLQCFPQWDFKHAMTPGGGIDTLRNVITRVDELAHKLEEANRIIDRLHDRIASLERELGVKPLTAFLPDSIRKRL